MLVLNSPVSKQKIKTSVDFGAAFLILVVHTGKRLEVLYTINGWFSMSCLKYHASLWKVSLIQLGRVWRGEKIPFLRSWQEFSLKWLVFKYNLLLNFTEPHSITLPQNQILIHDNYSLRYYGPPDLK